MTPNPPPPPPPPQGFPVETTSWWQRNKKWALPLLIIAGLMLLCCCGFGGWLAMQAKDGVNFFKEQAGAMQAIRSKATVIAQGHPEVVEAVGEPVTVGAIEAPNYNIKNGRVDFRFEMEVTGPSGKGRIFARAEAPDTASPPDLTELDFEHGNTTVNLLAAE